MDEEWVRAALRDGMPAKWIAETQGVSVALVTRFASQEKIRLGRDWAGVSGKIRESTRLRMLHREFAPTVDGR